MSASPLSSHSPPDAPSAAVQARRAALTLLGSACLFALMALFAREAAGRLPGAQIAFVRFAAESLVVAGLVVSRRIALRVRRANGGWLLARGLCGGLAVLAYFSAIAHLGVGIASLLNYTAPAWAVPLGWVLLGERPRGASLLALAVALAGVMLVLGPGHAAVAGGRWVLVGVASALLSAIAVTAIRAVRRAADDGLPPESSWTVFASFTGIGALATLPAAIAPLGHWVTPSPREWVLLLATALTSIVAQLLMTRALRYVTAPLMGVVHQLTVVLTLVFGVAFYGETLTTTALLGSALTVVGVVAAVAVAQPGA